MTTVGPSTGAGTVDPGWVDASLIRGCRSIRYPTDRPRGPTDGRGDADRSSVSGRPERVFRTLTDTVEREQCRACAASWDRAYAFFDTAWRDTLSGRRDRLAVVVGGH